MNLGTEDHLGDSLTVPKVNKDHPAMITAGGNPPAEGDSTSNIGRAQGAAEAITVVHEKIERRMKPES
jgi:hypothetical protein